MLFDALLHAASLPAREVELLRFFGVAGALVPSGGDYHPAGKAGLAAHWEATVGAARRLRRLGLRAWAAVGVHPRGIPRRGLAERLADLPAWLSRPEVAALGPCGLEVGGEEEEEVFLAQARLAAELRLPLLVRTSWRARERQVGRLLHLLDDAEVAPGRALVLHADARTVRAIRARGHLALLALSGRGGVEEAAKLVARLGPEGLVLGSDAGEGGGDLLSLPRAADRMARAKLSVGVIGRVCGGNAAEWLGIST